MKRATLILAALALLIGSVGPVIAGLVTNGGFETTTSFNNDKETFSASGVTGWSGGSNLTFLDVSGAAAADSTYLQVYGPFPNSPGGGHVVEADGNPLYSSAIYQTLSGLTVGQTYAVSFDQAAGQQTGFSGATTSQWYVNLSDTLDPTGGTAQLSSLMSDTSGGVVPWQAQTLSFTADATSEVLSFLAYGDGGNTANLPPISFLDDVSVNAVPEPASLTLSIVGMLGFGAFSLRRRARAKAAAV